MEGLIDRAGDTWFDEDAASGPYLVTHCPDLDLIVARAIVASDEHRAPSLHLVHVLAVPENPTNQFQSDRCVRGRVLDSDGNCWHHGVHAHLDGIVHASQGDDDHRARLHSSGQFAESMSRSVIGWFLIQRGWFLRVTRIVAPRFTPIYWKARPQPRAGALKPGAAAGVGYDPPTHRGNRTKCQKMCETGGPRPRGPAGVPNPPLPPLLTRPAPDPPDPAQSRPDPPSWADARTIAPFDLACPTEGLAMRP